MADSVVSPQSRPPRVASKKRRQATVSTETENKLARAARSAQRLAQLSDASRDDSTLDLFPDDPTLATLEAMNIDVRQGTLRGFELPDVVLAAVGAIDAGEGVSLDAKARRASRAAKADESVPVNAQLSGLEIEPATSAAATVQELVFADAKPTADAVGEEKTAARETATPAASAMAAATAARSVTALRQASGREASKARAVQASTSDSGTLPQGFSAKTAAGSREADATETANEAADVGSSEADDVTAGSVKTAGLTADGQPLAKVSPTATAAAAGSASTEANSAFAEARRETRRAAAAALRVAPELDRARATAFADTVDALYGVIADQRRAATDHSRRMKWMLSIVVGALLVTVAIGITQTLLLMRLTRETTAQQQRIEQMMQNQQTALASLLATHLATVNAAAASAASVVAATTAPQGSVARGLHAHKSNPLTLH